MNDEDVQAIEQVKQFLAGSGAFKIGGVSIEERYRWIQTVLVRFKYYQLKRAFERSDSAIYRETERLFPGTGIKTNTRIQSKGAIEEGTIQKASVPQELYCGRHCLVS